MTRVLRRGFEIIKTRSINEKIDIKYLETLYGIRIPPFYKLFAETFHLPFTDKGDEVKDLGKISSLICENSNSNIEKIYFDDLLPLDFSMSCYDEFEFYKEHGYMQIGSGPPGGGILLCLSGEKEDNIIYEYGQEFTIIASNIFEFCKKMIIQLNNETVELDRLHKKWNEDFWRIRDDNNI